jgi:hypothetical protein
MSDSEEIKPTDVGKVSEIIPPGQAIESSRRLDLHLNKSIRATRRGHLSSKISELAADMEDFNRETDVVLDGLRDKMQLARRKREEATEAQHGHFDGLIGDFQDTIDAVDRLSNLPFDNGGEK